MPKPVRTVLASLAFVATAAVASSPAFAERQISGAEAARLLSGKQFIMQCADGTLGYGVFNTAGVVNISYRRPHARQDAPDQRDRASVRSRGSEICLSWSEFDGGGDGCYAVSEKSAGHYRIGGSVRWCEIKARPATQTAQ